LSQVQEIEGIKIVTYCSPLYFANSEIFRQKIIAKVSSVLGDQKGQRVNRQKMDTEKVWEPRTGHPQQRVEVKIAVGYLPTDRYGSPESVTCQAEMPQEAGEESSAHTAEEVSLHENQGEQRPGMAPTPILVLPLIPP
jgi:hypothetical protein